VEFKLLHSVPNGGDVSLQARAAALRCSSARQHGWQGRPSKCVNTTPPCNTLHNKAIVCAVSAGYTLLLPIPQRTDHAHPAPSAYTLEAPTQKKQPGQHNSTISQHTKQNSQPQNSQPNQRTPTRSAPCNAPVRLAPLQQAALPLP
jgi:hypothetical protein